MRARAGLRPGLVALVSAAMLMSGCGGLSAAPGDATPSPTPTAYPTASPSPYEGPAGSGEYAGLRLSADGLGPIVLGLDVAEGRERGWVARLPHCDRWGASPVLIAEGVDLVFDESDRLAEIWLGNPVHPTVEGARVGMRLEEIAYLYGPRLAFERRGAVSGTLRLPLVRNGDREVVFFGIGDEDATPGPHAPVSAIGARAYGGDIERPQC